MILNLSKVFTLFVTGLMILAIPLVLSADGDSGGTDGTVMFAEAGGSGEFEWNDIHAFVIEENSVKVEEPFNVTICETVKEDKDTGQMRPSGYIFGTLNGITWDEKPEPTITISNQDFEDYKEDDNNLTAYAYGEYYDEDNLDAKERYAYKQVTITKPNNPPTPIARVAEEGNWTWINLTEESDVTFTVESGDDITLWFNAELSWDEDDEDVTGWAWELDEDGKFGGAGETQENVSRVFTVGKTYMNLGLIVFDERGKESATSVDFNIEITSPPRLPDLEAGEIQYENKNQNKDNYEVGDTIIVQPKINNIGENDTEAGFSVLIEYSKDNGASYTTLTTVEITDVIASGNFKLLTYNWDTGGFGDGQYLIRVTADSLGEIEEDDEDNNVNTTNLIPLDENKQAGTPILAFESIVADKTTAKVNEPVNVTITVENTGDGAANYVDIKFDINGEYMYFRTIDLIAAGTNESLIIQFTGDAKGDFVLGFILEDDKTQIGSKETVTITVTKPNGGDPVIPPIDNNGDNDDGGFIPGFEVVALIGAVLAGAVLFSGKRRR
jgi:hypothetical protein